MFFQSFDVLSSMLWTFVADIVSLLWCLLNMLTIWMAILLLLIYIKKYTYLLLSDTSTIDQERYVPVQFHAVLLSVAFIAQQCQLLQ
jgi:hypothetical protein